MLSIFEFSFTFFLSSCCWNQ